MTSISPELLEAARIDGASPRQEFRRITLPLVLYSTAVSYTHLDGAIFIGNYTHVISEEMQALGRQLVLIDSYDEGTQLHLSLIHI